MPEVVKCHVCGKRMHVKNFQDQMKKIREHRQKEHPRKFKESVRKSVATRKRNKRG